MAVRVHNPHRPSSLSPHIWTLQRRYTNGAFCVDMPRGCVTVMEEGSYAANGLKHCVRPVDMAGTLMPHLWLSDVVSSQVVLAACPLPHRPCT